MALLAAVGGNASVPAEAQEVAPSVFMPGFWDPQAPPEKPSLAGLDSIKFLTGDDYPPFNLTLPDGTLGGFNVDLARALCRELQLTCTVQRRTWDGIVPALKGGQGDAAIASMAISDAARRDVDFTGPYYKTPARFVIRLPTTLGTISPDSLAGKLIGVQAGTAHQAYLTLFFPKVRMRAYPTIDAARAALKAGEVDGIFADAIGSAIWLNGTDSGDCCAFTGGPYTETRFFGRGSGIAVRKGSAALRQALDYALARVAAKGIYGDIYLKYFPIGFY